MKMKMMILIFSLVTFNLFGVRAGLLNGSGEMQQIKITGTVTDEKGNSLPGVSVVVKGTTVGTLTDATGKYVIEKVPQGSILVFSFVGMSTQEVPTDGRTSINIALKEESVSLDEVVVIGYGTQQRREVTSSIATVKEESFNKGAITKSPIQIIQGKIAGLAISHTGGGDPTKGYQIQMRGVSTVRGDASPLVVIDGIPGGSLSSLSPDDIASVDVLRDGSAAAIYGTRGNAGVIIVTTKKGTPGKLSIKYSGYAYTETWLKKPEVLNAAEWRQTKTNFENSGIPFLVTKASNLIDYGSDTYWVDEITRKNPISNVHNLSITGGSSNTNYFASVNYSDLQGFIKESSNNILKTRLSITHTGLDNKLSVRLSVNNSMGKSHPVNYDTYRQALDRNPTMPVYNADGTYNELQGYNRFNPVALLTQYQQDNDNSNTLALSEISYEVLKGLKLRVNGAIQRNNGISGYFEQRDAFASVLGGYKGYASRSGSLSIDRTLEEMINYSTVLNGVHNLNVIGGYSYQDFSDESFSASNRDFITNAFEYNNLGAGLQISQGKYSAPVSSSKSSSKLIAFFGRVNYNYDERYMLSASLRQEGSSRFGADNKWGLFPAVSAGWVISRESFMSSVSFIDDLKLRIGYGVTGNQGIGNYYSLERLSPSGKMFYNNTWVPGYAPASNANPNLRWEKKAETNLGIDITMFKSIVVNIDLYDRTTKDLLYEYEVPVPPNLYGTTWNNVGRINNQGIEFSISANPVQNSKFNWKTDFNISYNKNKLISLSNDEFTIKYLDVENLGGRMSLSGVYAYRLEEGQPVGNMFGWKFAGFTDDGKWQFWDKTNTKKLSKSEVKYEDKRIIGNGLPKSWLGFTNTFTYGDFDLTVALRGAFGFNILNTQAMWYENLSILPNNIFRVALDKEVMDDIQWSDYYVEDGDYLKLDNITLGYSVPAKGVIKGLRVYASAQSLFTLTKYSGPDPEMSIAGLAPGIDYHTIYPSVKTFTLGVNVEF